MALYLSISLLAVLVATPSGEAGHGRVRTAGIVFLTAVGLLLAHQVAFRMSTRLLTAGLLDEESLRILGAQTLGGLPVAVAASLPVLLVGGTAGVLVGELALLAVVAGVGYASSRRSGASRLRALLYVGGVVVVVAGVLALKLAVGH